MALEFQLKKAAIEAFRNPDVDLGDFAYDASPKLWDEFYHSEGNYIPKEEIDLIDIYAPAIIKIIKSLSNGSPLSLIEFGPGSKSAVYDKTLKIVNAIKPERYMSIDLCKQYAENAAAIVKSSNPKIRVNSLCQDFYKNFSIMEPPHVKVGLILGSTISNIAEKTGSDKPYVLIENLRHIKKILGTNSFIILTQDTNQDEASLLKAYDSEICKIQSVAILDEIEYLFGGSFKASQYYYYSDFDKDTFCYTGYGIAGKKQTLGDVSIKRGQKVSLFKSYKYDAKYFEKNAQDAGMYSLMPPRKLLSNRVALHLYGTSKPAI